MATNERPQLPAANYWPGEAEGKPAASKAPDAGAGPPSRPRPAGVNGPLTEKVPCGKGCGTLVNPGTKTGWCQPCVREAWRTGELAHPPREGQPRKREVDGVHGLASMTGKMLERLLRRADPEQSLPTLLQFQRIIDVAVAEAGTAWVAETDPSVVAAELSRELGETWSRQRVDNRWGRKS